MKLPKFFKIVDGYHAFHDGQIFETANDAWDNLADYHSIDWDGETDDGEPIELYDYLAKMKDDEEKLNFMLEHGQWETEEVQAINCPLCGIAVEHKEHNETHLWPCSECNFVGFEYESNNNCADVVNYLNRKNA